LQVSGPCHRHECTLPIMHALLQKKKIPILCSLYPREKLWNNSSQHSLPASLWHQPYFSYPDYWLQFFFPRLSVVVLLKIRWSCWLTNHRRFYARACLGALPRVYEPNLKRPLTRAACLTCKNFHWRTAVQSYCSLFQKKEAITGNE